MDQLENSNMNLPQPTADMEAQMLGNQQTTAQQQQQQNAIFQSHLDLSTDYSSSLGHGLSLDQPTTTTMATSLDQQLHVQQQQQQALGLGQSYMPPITTCYASSQQQQQQQQQHQQHLTLPNSMLTTHITTTQMAPQTAGNLLQTTGISLNPQGLLPQTFTTQNVLQINAVNAVNAGSQFISSMNLSSAGMADPMAEGISTSNLIMPNNNAALTTIQQMNVHQNLLNTTSSNAQFMSTAAAPLSSLLNQQMSGQNPITIMPQRGILYTSQNVISQSSHAIMSEPRIIQLPPTAVTTTSGGTSGMMIFRDKMTGKNFLIPTGPPSTREITELPPLPPEMSSADPLISDPKPILDVSEFLNIPPKSTPSSMLPDAGFEPITEDDDTEEEEEEEEYPKVRKIEPMDDGREQGIVKPALAKSRGKDLQKAMLEQGFGDISQTEEEEDEDEESSESPDEDEDDEQHDSKVGKLKISIKTFNFQMDGKREGSDEMMEEGTAADGVDDSRKKSEDMLQRLSKFAKKVERNESGSFVVHVDEDQCVVVDGLKKWRCIKCPKMYSSKHNLVTHILGHEGIKPHRCLLCGKTFKQTCHLQTHMMIHSTRKAHTCHVCNRGFTQGSHLKRHLATHLTDRPHLCTVCGKSFMYPGELRQHVEKQHEGSTAGTGGKHPCPHCDAHLPTPYALKQHMHKRHKRAADLTCKVCGKVYVYPSQLRDHQQKHEGTRPFACEHCDMTFMKEHHLRAHEFTHTGLQPFVCLLCNRAFNQKANLQRHMLIHQDTKPFKCDQCDRSFSQAQVLKSHMIVHAEHKPYKCQICRKEFSRQHNLKGHMALHKGGKQYVCFCGASFTLKGNLNRHQKFKHGKEGDTGDGDGGGDGGGEEMGSVEGGGVDHQEAAHILQGMSHQPVHHEPSGGLVDGDAMTENILPGQSRVELTIVGEMRDASGGGGGSDATVASTLGELCTAGDNVNDASANPAQGGGGNSGTTKTKRSPAKRKFLSYEELTAEELPRRESARQKCKQEKGKGDGLDWKFAKRKH